MAKKIKPIGLISTGSKLLHVLGMVTVKLSSGLSMRTQSTFTAEVVGVVGVVGIVGLVGAGEVIGVMGIVSVVGVVGVGAVQPTIPVEIKENRMRTVAIKPSFFTVTSFPAKKQRYFAFGRLCRLPSFPLGRSLSGEGFGTFHAVFRYLPFFLFHIDCVYCIQ